MPKEMLLSLKERVYLATVCLNAYAMVGYCAKNCLTSKLAMV